MSLILDALKKLERDKDAREPNVLVVGSVPWGTRARSRLPLVVALTGAALLAVVVFALWPRDRAAGPPATPTPPAMSSPGATPTPSVSGAAPPAPAAPTAVAAPEPRRRSVTSAGSGAADDQPAETTEAPDEAPATAPAPPRRGAAGTDELRLNAISQRDGRPVALINDRLVFEGDGFDDVKVLRIGETEVEVEVRGVKRILRF
ncbi:MAG TPA: hypothetical protein VLL75_12970 [Vicinamibacteria bacterium]|nr:hypothetical protein [Vicinamibacteria bacterium]